MTSDDTFDLAAKAGISELMWWDHGDVLERFAALVAAAEREQCAKVCEAEGERFKHHPSGRRDFSICAAAIRARGEQEQPR
jgi:hypothetical protein